MQRLRLLAPSILLFLALFVGVGSVTITDSFQTCVESEQHRTPPETKDWQDSLLHRASIKLWCTSAFIEANNAIITALATVVIAAFTFTLWRATTDQGRLTKQALIANRRAFVFPTNINPVWELDRFFTRNYNWRIQPAWKNSGDTTTKDLSLFVDCIVTNRPIESALDLVERYRPGTGNFLGPGTSNFGGAAPFPPASSITPFDILEISKGRRFAYLWGWARYYDVFEGTPEHITRFCWQIFIAGDPFAFVPGANPASLTFGYAQMPFGNCADEGCRKDHTG